MRDGDGLKGIIWQPSRGSNFGSTSMSRPFYLRPNPWLGWTAMQANWYRRNVVHIPCGSRQIVEGRKHEAAKAVHFNSNTKKPINLSQEVFPLGRQDVRGIRRHIEAPRAASCLGHSNRVLLSSDASSAIGARSRSHALRLTVRR